ncbi:MAG: formyltetrahydrofolate deformylase [Verrucomicrobia bacterium]|nr:formyltetrahydrofolate deformylase [Verrucomicrobiota bacterium]
MSASQNTITALLSGTDQPGLVAKMSGWIFERGGNIIHADQHRDMEAEIFFQRIEWTPAEPQDDFQAEVDAFQEFTSGLNMKVDCKLSSKKSRVAVFVSRYDHCLHELILGQRSGELSCEIDCVISNHPDMAEAAEQYGVPFIHVSVTPDTKNQAEKQQLEILKDRNIDVVVMARYMQILSPEFLQAFGKPVINIHHSFLPAFAGGKPYHQAHQRGVKLIGATAHYATAVLDDGPIIQQDVERVSHRHTVEDLVVRGRMLERRVLAQALRWHLENRVLVYGRKTVVFD